MTTTNYSGWPTANGTRGYLKVRVRMWNMPEVHDTAVNLRTTMHQAAEFTAYAWFGVRRGSRQGSFYFTRQGPDGVHHELGTSSAPVVEGELLTLWEPAGHGG